MDKTHQTFKPKAISKVSIAFIYFAQGIYLSLISNIPYFYQTFPSTQTLNYFNIALLPFSMKYLTALIVQKISFARYGRRKFWIILTQAITYPITFLLSYIVIDDDKAIPTAILIFLIMLMVSMGDVAVDAIAVKDLNDPVLAGKLQAIMQPLGIVANNYFIILLTHQNVWNFIGISQALTTPEIYLKWVAIIGILITIVMHSKYQQRHMQNQDDSNSIIDILKYYKHFIQLKYSLCRQAIFFLFFHQGINFFISLFTPYAISLGFPKEEIQQLGSHCTVISIAVNLLLSRYVTLQSQYKVFLKVYFLEIVVFMIVYLQGSFTHSIIVFVFLFMSITSSFRFLICSTIISSFGTGKYSGLCITTIASLFNFGRNSWPQLKIKEYVGFNNAIGGGLGLGILIGLVGGRWTSWIKQGKPQDQLEQQKND